MTTNENDKQAEPVAWVRRHPDGALTAEFLEDAVIEPARKKSGTWVPLYNHPAPAVAHEPVAGWIQFVDGKQTQNFCRDKDEMQAIDKISRLMNKTLNITYQPVYTHPAPAVAHHPTLKATGIHTERDGKMYQTCEVLSPTMPDSGTLLYTEAPAVAVNEQMLEALKLADAALEGAHMNADFVYKKVKAAIAAAEAAKGGAA